MKYWLSMWSGGEEGSAVERIIAMTEKEAKLIRSLIRDDEICSIVSIEVTSGDETGFRVQLIR